jgi:hypothetical protein
MPRRVARPFRQYPIPHYPAASNHWNPDNYIAQQAALSREFNRLGVDETDDGQITRRFEQPDYTKKDFKRAAEDLKSCLEEAQQFFPKFEAEFATETKEIKKYVDEKLLNIIWEKKVQRFENGPRVTESNPDEPSSNSATSTTGIRVLQHRIKVTVQAMLECKYPEPTDDDDTGPQIRFEEVRDFEDRMQRTAFRLNNSLGNVAHNLQAFRRVIRDIKAMSGDLDLYPLQLWKADGPEPDSTGYE